MMLEEIIQKGLELEYIISGVCGLLLLLITIALIFNSKFRKDMVAGEGSANLFGVSVEGAIIVVLSGMFLAGLVFPLYNSKDKKDDSLTSFLQSLPFDVNTEDAVRSEITDLLTVQTNYKALEDKNKELESALEESVHKEQIDDYIKSLNPEDVLSFKLIAIEKGNLGPWSPSSNAVEVLISVPGKYKKGFNYSCNDYYLKEVEFISNYKEGERIIKGKSKINLKINGLISRSLNCRAIQDYDFQLNCHDALDLFSKEILTCDKDNNPLWNIKGKKRLSAYATKIYKVQSPLFINANDETTKTSILF